MRRDNGRAVLKALHDHYRQHPHVRPTLAEVALAMAQMDGNLLADRPELLEQAALNLAAVKPDADGDDVLVEAANLARRP